MSHSLNVIALISGGKDSLFSLLHCVRNGHQIVALANLHPPASPSENDPTTAAGDINSFMYQTVGHSAIPMIAECLQAPLFRRLITGSAVDTNQEYDRSRDNEGRHDETEDLLLLLQDILVHHPNANAICSGAILSTYQRTRVESVALRLGLVPLAYLWQYPILPSGTDQAVDKRAVDLLADMEAAGLEARIIKIASGGIRPDLLWANVTETETRSRLQRGLTPYFAEDDFGLRASVIGEGGEYETLVLDGPGPVWKIRLSFEPSDIQFASGEGGVGYVVLGNGKAIPKDLCSRENLDPATVRLPSIYDGQFQQLRHNCRYMPSNSNKNQHHGESFNTIDERSILRPSITSTGVSALRIGQTVSIANIVHPDSGMTAAAQVQAVMTKLKAVIQSLTTNSDNSLSLSNVDFTLLIVKSMSDFEAANRAYALTFREGEPNPPARVTIAASLPDEVKVSISVVLSRLPHRYRRGLHVQSRSYWAPANIGPYSQAICVPLQTADDTLPSGQHVEGCFVAGQIPLVPSSMEMLSSGFEELAILSLQHLWRIGQERKVDIWPWAVAFLRSSEDIHPRAVFAAEIWKQLHNQASTEADGEGPSDDDFDIGDLHLQRSFVPHRSTSSPHTLLSPLPNLSLIDAANDQAFVAPLIVAEVVNLPRNAEIEWWSTGITHLANLSSGLRPHFKTTSWSWGCISTMMFPSRPEISDDTQQDTTVSFTAILIYHQTSELLPELIQVLHPILPSTHNNSNLAIAHGTALAAGSHGLALYNQLSHHFDINGVAIISCNQIHGAAPTREDDTQLKPLRLAIVIRTDELDTQASHSTDPA